MAERKKSKKAVIFIDLNYKQRTITIGDDTLEVCDSRVVAEDPAHIAALDEMYGIERETASGEKS